MRHTRTARRALVTLATTAAAMTAAVSTALASSIVYLKSGNVWLTSPDGSAQYQVTFGGGYDQPSQTADGTIVAVRAGQFVRLDRSGRPLNAPIDWFGNEPPAPGSKADQFFGPYHARVSPDGAQIAYAFKQREYDCDPITNICSYQIVQYTTTSAANRSTPVSPSTSVSRDGDPAWIDNSRMVVSDPFDPQQINTWVAGHGDDGEQWWFDGSVDQNGFGDLEREAALSPDGSKLIDVAAVGGQFSPYDHLDFYTTHGPAWIGDPPYGNNDPNAVRPPPPTLSCVAAPGPVDDPVWSPDSTLIAFQLGDGIHVAPVPADISQPGSCARITDRLLVPGGSQPFWGPADVNMAQAPAPPGAGSGGSGSGGPTGGRNRGTLCSVPNLRHLTLPQARAALRRHHCRLGTVHRQHRRPGDHTARVRGQSPHAQAVRHRHFPVNVTVD
jgi:hypothetical protein